MKRTAALAAVALATLAAPGRGRTAPAGDRPGTVAIVSLEITGDGAPELRAQLQRSLAGGIGSTGARAVELDAVLTALRGAPELIGCTSTTCLKRIGEIVGADHFLRARVDSTGSSYSIELELLDAEQGGVARFEQSCDVCTITELNDMVSQAASELITRPRSEPATVAISSEPAGASLRIDDQDVGPTPYRGQLAPGSHRVTATLPGHLAAEQTITVAAGGEEPQAFRLTLVVDAGSTPVDAPGRPFRLWKWVAAGAAGAALVTGVMLIAADGEGTCELGPGERQCPDVRDSATAGWLSAGAGIALGAASGWMFVRDSRDQRRAEAIVVPVAGGAVASLTLRF